MITFAAYDLNELPFASTTIENNDETMEEVNIDDEITLDIKQNDNTDARSEIKCELSNSTYMRVYFSFRFGE